MASMTSYLSIAWLFAVKPGPTKEQVELEVQTLKTRISHWQTQLHIMRTAPYEYRMTQTDENYVAGLLSMQEVISESTANLSACQIRLTMPFTS